MSFNVEKNFAYDPFSQVLIKGLRSLENYSSFEFFIYMMLKLFCNLLVLGKIYRSHIHSKI